MEKVPNEKMVAKHTAPIVAVFKQKFVENFKRLTEGARTCILWVQYHYMVDVIIDSLRSSSELKSLYTIMGTFPVL